MSPSESQLRAALRAGEGQPVNPEVVIAHARTVRHNRRMRVGSIAAAVIAVGGIGTGIAALNTGPNGSNGSSNTAGGAIAGDKAAAPEATAPRAAPSTAGAAGGSRGGAGGPDAASCPDKPIRLMIPGGGGGTGQFGGSGPLFAEPVDSIRVCGYAASSLGGRIDATGSTVLLGQDADEVAASLNAAATTRKARPCPVEPVRELVLYPIATSGGRLATVVVTYGGCAPWATNGTAVRYDWTPPPGTAGLLNRLMLSGPALPSVPGPYPIEPSGSPVR
jgi:hypothetical protein